MDRTIRGVVTDSVARFAPQEQPLVDFLGSLDQNVVAPELRRRQSANELNFGPAEISVIVTPVVWIALDEATRAAVRAAVEGFLPRVRAAFLWLFGRRPPAPTELPDQIPPLSRNQLAVVRQRVTEGGALMGMNEVLADELADFVVARLTLDPLEHTKP